jgi:hypothetical protein
MISVELRMNKQSVRRRAGHIDLIGAKGRP